MLRSRSGVLSDVAVALAPLGLILRGGFHPEPEEDALPADVGTLLLVGNAGPAIWDAFAPHIDGAPDPVNRWTKRVIDPIAEKSGARALYPFGEPHWPFQRWAERTETLYRSPLGILIHPQYGLWHAYRAALLFAERVPLPARSDAPNPCESCATKPCLTACPVGAFDGVRYDVPACGGHLASIDDRGSAVECLTAGCLARAACPVGAGWRYSDQQIRFHMVAFARSVAGLASPEGASSHA